MLFLSPVNKKPRLDQCKPNYNPQVVMPLLSVISACPLSINSFFYALKSLFMLRLRCRFCTRQHICYSAYMLSPVRPSVCLSVRLSVTRVDQSKTVEARIMQLSSQSSPMTLVSSWLIPARNFKGNVGSGDAK